MKFEERTKGEQEFIDQMTRKLMTTWAGLVVSEGVDGMVHIEYAGIYMDYAESKKWIRMADYDGQSVKVKVLSLGWKTAAAFLRR